ncbi:MAG: hypothetical protein WD048_04755 [Chitinophagales bacterium]
MKTLLISILSLFYLLISTGITVNAHYCKGELIGVKSPWAAEQDCKKSDAFCPASTNDKHPENTPFCCAKDNKDCCEEDLIQIKMELPAINASSQSISFIDFHKIFYTGFVKHAFHSDEIQEFTSRFYRPPPLFSDIRIFFHSLIFYH